MHAGLFTEAPLRKGFGGDSGFYLFILTCSYFDTFWVKVPFKLKMLLK